MNLKELLRQISDKDLNEEFERRRRERVKAHAEQMEKRVCCQNCRNRIMGYTSKTCYYQRTVCKERPKAGYFNSTSGKIEQVYFACNAKYNNNCELFKRK